MNDTNAGNAPQPYWFVGASYGGTDDQTGSGARSTPPATSTSSAR